MQWIAFCLLLSAPVAVTAATVYKCTSPGGSTTFSQTPCEGRIQTLDISPVSTGTGHSRTAAEQLQEMQRIRGGSNSPAPAASSTPSYRCPPMSSTARKNKIRQDEVFECMTKSELVEVVGRRPNNIREESSGRASFHWHLGSNSFHAFFDTEGRLESWSGWHR